MTRARAAFVAPLVVSLISAVVYAQSAHPYSAKDAVG